MSDQEKSKSDQPKTAKKAVKKATKKKATKKTAPPAKTGKKQAPSEHPSVQWRWPKGVSGNPNGRPKGRPNLATLLGQLLDSNIPPNLRDDLGKRIGVKLDKNVSFEQAMQLSIAYEALKNGDHTRWNALHNRVEGAIPQPVELGGDIKVSIQIADHVPKGDDDGKEKGRQG